MSNATIPSDFLRSVLQNGVGRYVCQLKRVTLKFCKSHGGSKGVREFIETELIDFARQNPGTVVYLQPRRHRGPVISAEYLNGNKDWLYCQNYTRDEVRKWLEYMKNKSGLPIVRIRKYHHTDSPSIQGVWHPFIHKPTHLNLAKFPCPERSEHYTPALSATEQLLQIAKAEKNVYVDDEDVD
ncbi:39S ribosomal protein L43, mitochondrial-like [Centruroides sculpturatus]|uniref:39S ribosomal protein L43, mitochondrial-like n=1 Tax=Centruroides sculpturatus TaxID=218467 RepID=UPI000C6EB123|nr:39S ribosomal protein L43, mitochondrial-like [Centruroides sculpturatus]